MLTFTRIHRFYQKIFYTAPQTSFLTLKHMSTNPLSRLCGKIAVITASTEGIGFATARRLAQEGAHVLISSRKQKNVDDAVTKLKCEGLKASGIVCHVSNTNDRKNLFAEAEKLGGLDILISNAAVNPSLSPVLDCDEAAWDKIFDVNVKTSFLLAKEALPLIRKRKGGRIIFISSIGGFQPGEPFENLGAYSVSKTALIGLTKAASVQLAKENITVNCIAPGIVQTKFSKILVDDEEKRNKVLSRIPLGRLAQPQDIAAAAAYLASEDASYITGETIIVAGGMPSRL